MSPELMAMCELVMTRCELKDKAFKELNGTPGRQVAYDRAVKAWAMADSEYQLMLRQDIEKNG